VRRIQRVRQALLLSNFISFVSKGRIFPWLEAAVLAGLGVCFLLAPASDVPQIIIQIANLEWSRRIGNILLAAGLPRDGDDVTDVQPSVAGIVRRPVLDVGLRAWRESET
jgi:hypothetical protein